jgi:hypothetical protein
VARSLRLAGYIGIGIVAGLLVAIVTIMLLTRTPWGMERARVFIVGWLDERVDGELRLSRITGPGLLGGAIIHDFGIVDPRGRPFLSTDSLELAYDWRTLLRGRIELNRVVLYGPNIVIERLPGDTVWNYEHVFPDRTPGEPPGERSLILFHDARVVNGTATLRVPIEPGTITQPADTARIIVEQVPGGLARSMRFEDINARLDRVIWESPIEPGRLVDVRSLQTRGFVWREPVLIRDARGTVTTRDSIVAFDMPEVQLPGSRAGILGHVVVREGRNLMDIRVDGERLLFRDLQWFHPDLPAEGGGSLVLRIQSQPDGTLYLAEDARLSAPGTRVSGSFGIVMAEDSLYFTRVNLRASPLDVRLIEAILPGGLPVEGLLIGTIEVSGPLSALETRGDMQFTGTGQFWGAGAALPTRAAVGRPAVGAGGPAVRGGRPAGETTAGRGAATSGRESVADIAWRGVVDVRNMHSGSVVARSFHADVRQLELALLSAFDPDVRLAGSVAGQVDATGRTDALRFTTSFVHSSSTGGHSTIDGGGSITGQGRDRRFDLLMNASPATLYDLSSYVPALRGMEGELTGPVRIIGTADDLDFNAQLVSPAGLLHLDGSVSQTPAGRRVRAVARADGFALHRLRHDLPAFVVSGDLSVDVTGDDLATATGHVALLLDSARLGDLPSGRVAVHGRLSNGVLAVDSAFVRSLLGVGRAHGTVALSADREGLLEMTYTSESLVPLEAYLFGDARAAPDAEPRIAGRVDGTASLTGWLRNLELRTTARGEDLRFGSFNAGRLRLDASAAGIGSEQPLVRMRADADSVGAWRHSVRTAHLDVSGRADSLSIGVSAGGEGREVFLVRADLERGPARLAAPSRRLAAPSRTEVVEQQQSDNGLPRLIPAAAPPPASSVSTATRLRIDELRVGAASPWRLSRQANISLIGEVAHIDTIQLIHDGGGHAIAHGRLGWSDFADGSTAGPPGVTGGGAPLDFGVSLHGVPFTELLRAARSTEDGAGHIEGSLRLYGTALDPLIETEITAHDITYGDVRIDRAFAEASYAARGLDAHAEAQYGGRSFLTGGGRIPLDLRLAPVGERRTAEPLRFTVSADSLPPALPLGLLDGFTNVGGRLDGILSLGGTSLDPTLSGGFTVRNGTADWDVSGVRYRDINGTLTLEGDRLLHVDVRAFAGDPRSRGARTLAGAAGGSGTIEGTLDFAQLGDPLFDLRFMADRAYAARRRDVEASVTGAILLGGRYSRPEVSGSIRVDEGALYLDELYRQYLIVGLELDDPSLLSLVDTSLVAVRPLLAASSNPFLRGLHVRNMQVAVAADTWLRSRDMDVEVTGDLTIAFDRRHEDLRLSGSLNVERGTYTLYYPPLQSRRFQVRQGAIDFPGTPGIDPNLSITAAYKARAQGEPLDVLAIVGGTLQNPRVRLSSDAQPPISESDLASYLFFGVPTWEVANTGGGAGDVRAVAGLGARALGPSVLGYASSGLQTLVQSAGLFDYVGLTAAEVAPADQTGNGLTRMFAGTQLELGRYLSSNIFFGYTQRLGSGTYDPAVRLEWRFLPEHSFELFAEDRLARTPGFGARTETGLRKVYGFSLFREWGF